MGRWVIILNRLVSLLFFSALTFVADPLFTAQWKFRDLFVCFFFFLFGLSRIKKSLKIKIN